MKNNRLWTGLSSILAFVLVVAILGYSCMMDYAGTVNQALGISTSEVENPEGVDEDELIYYPSEYGALDADNLQKLIEDTYDEAVQEQEEGSVLLTNNDNALPLTSDERSVTLFGHAVAQPLYKSASAGSSGTEGEYCISLYDALKDAGFEINDTLYDAYESSSTERGTGSYDYATGETSALSLGEESIDFYTSDIQNSWADNYNDAAIVMFAREGGEGIELMIEDDEGKSQLALHKDEEDLLAMIRDSGKFGKIIVLLNNGNPMELGWLEEYDVDACLWIGEPGQRGFEGVANILTGAANPSGKLTDTYAVSSTSAPSVVNGSYNNQQWTNLDEVLAGTGETADDDGWYDVQAESIYVGYKYYETRYEDTVLGQGNADSTKGSTSGNAWNYLDEVSFPYGYGLSYTSFEQELVSVESHDGTLTATVNVTNTGDTAGKSVVQLYAQTPYGSYEKSNNVEKSAIQLLDFGKTDTLEPGESETVTIDADEYLLASYDYTNAKTYVMSEGTYYFTIGDDAHDALNNVLAAKGASGMVAVAADASTGDAGKVQEVSYAFDSDTYSKTAATGEEVTNQFEDCDLNYWIDGGVTYLSRSDWDATYPTEATQITATKDMITEIAGDYYEKPEDAPSVSDFTQGDQQEIPLASLIGLDYDDPAWDTYLNQFTISELASLTADNFGTVEIAEVGKPAIVAGDGPDGLGATFAPEYGDTRDETAFPTEIVLASTYNKDLMERRGDLMAEEAMYCNLTYLWMPGVNIHRTPFGGRNFEYYAEDANMNYLCEGIEVAAVEAKGIHAGEKHVTGNDQENNRQGISCFFNEQAFREGSLRGTEGSITVGGGEAIMNSFNRLGMKWSSASHALCTQVMRNEWGFIGMAETDALTITEPTGYKSHFTSTLSAGTDIYCLDFAGISSRMIESAIEENDDGYLLQKLRDAAKNQLYIDANSATMNGYSPESKVVAVTPWWIPAMYAVIGISAVLLIVCLVILTIGKTRKSKEKEAA